MAGENAFLDPKVVERLATHPVPPFGSVPMGSVVDGTKTIALWLAGGSVVKVVAR